MSSSVSPRCRYHVAPTTGSQRSGSPSAPSPAWCRRRPAPRARGRHRHRLTIFTSAGCGIRSKAIIDAMSATPNAATVRCGERCHSHGHDTTTSTGASSANCSREKARAASAVTRTSRERNGAPLGDRERGDGRDRRIQRPDRGELGVHRVEPERHHRVAEQREDDDAVQQRRRWMRMQRPRDEQRRDRRESPASRIRSIAASCHRPMPHGPRAATTVTASDRDLGGGIADVLAHGLHLVERQRAPRTAAS